MTASDLDGGTAVSREKATAYRRTATRLPVRTQMEHLAADLRTLSVLTAGGDLMHARGAALTIAHAALKLVVTPTVDEDERRRRADLLRSIVVPALEAAELGHVGALVEAALAYDGDPAGVAQGVEMKQ